MVGILGITPLNGKQFIIYIHIMQTTLTIGRQDLLETSREKRFEQIQGGDLPWTMEQCQAEVIWFEEGGKKRRIKDREHELDGLVLNSPTSSSSTARMEA